MQQSAPRANRIVQWMRDSIELISNELTIDNYPTVLSRGARTFRTTCRLTVGPELHAGRPGAIVAVKLKGGLWQTRAAPMSWKIPKVDRADKYALAVIRARVTIHRWTKGTGKARTMFLRVGNNGAVAMMPNGDKIVIAEPPLPAIPPSHTLQLVPFNGHLIDQRTVNPDFAIWQEWEAEVADAAEIVRRVVDGLGEPIDARTIESHSRSQCKQCHLWAKEDDGARWRRLPRGEFYCQRCADEIGASFAEAI